MVGKWNDPEYWTFRLAKRGFWRFMSTVFQTAGTAFMVMLLWGGAPVLAQEAISEEVPTPSSVDQIVTPMDRSFKEITLRPGFFPWVKEKLKDTPPFLRDTKLDLNIRTYYFDRENYDNSKNQALAVGGALAYRSGWLLNHFGGGAVLYTSQPVYAPKDQDGTLLLAPGQEGYTVLGQIYGRVKLIEDNYVNLFRYEYNTPYINKNDSRMTPNTFEAYTFTGAYGGKDGALGFRYGFGYFDKIKPRNSSVFIPMSEAAGAVDVTRGVFAGGGNVSYKGFNFGAIDYYSSDIINIFYTEGSYKLNVTDGLGVLFAAQFTDQQSNGKNLMKGYSFYTNQFGIKSDVSYGGAILTLGYSTTANGADMQNPWSSYPGYTSVQVKDFNRASESAFIGKISYDFSRLGLEGVTAYTLFVHGWGRKNPSTGEAVSNENEWDVDVQWRPPWKWLKGLWFRVRYAYVHQYEGDKNTLNDFRVIVNYDLPLM